MPKEIKLFELVLPYKLKPVIDCSVFGYIQLDAVFYDYGYGEKYRRSLVLSFFERKVKRRLDLSNPFAMLEEGRRHEGLSGRLTHKLSQVLTDLVPKVIPKDQINNVWFSSFGAEINFYSPTVAQVQALLDAIEVSLFYSRYPKHDAILRFVVEGTNKAFGVNIYSEFFERGPFEFQCGQFYRPK